MRTFRKYCLLTALLVLFSVPVSHAQIFSSGGCQTAVPEDMSSEFTPLPQGEIFCSFLADPKSVHSFVSVLHGTSEDFPSEIGSVGIGDNVGIFRWGSLQLSVAGSVFSQFDLGSPSYDLINADYIISLPLTFRREGLSARLRAYHQSSHLGDEFLLRRDLDRENLSFESIELMVSQEVGWFRLYGGGERIISPSPEDLASFTLQGGAEIRPGATLLKVGRLGSMRWIGAADVKSIQEQDWNAAVSLRTGFEASRAEAPSVPITRWQILFEYYDGPTPYGQFFRSDMSYWGIGIHFTR